MVVVWYNTTFLLIGLIAVILALTVDFGSLADELLSLAGGSLVSAAIVSFVFGSITIRETTLQVTGALSRSVEDVLGPLRESIYQEALRAYRWNCHLDLASRDDPHPEYLTQLLRICYERTGVPATLKVACLATFQPDAWGPFTGDEYVLRWMVDESLDPHDETVFTVIALSLDGAELRCTRERDVRVAGGTGVEWSYRVPQPIDAADWHEIEYKVLVRKHIGDDSRFQVQSNLFRPVTECEYTLTLGPGIGVDKVLVSTDGMTPFVGGLKPRSGYVYGPDHAYLGAYASAQFPIQRDSIIVFNVHRTNGRQTK